MKSEHVTFVVQSLAIGGMEKFVVLLGGELRRRGYGVSVACTQEGGPLAQEAEALGISVRVLPFTSRWDNINPSALTEALRSLGTTVVHSQSGCWLAAAIAGRRAGVRVCHTEHGMTSRPERIQLILQKRVALALSHATVVVSSQLREELAAQLHVKQEVLTFVPNGIPMAQHARNPEMRRATREALGVADSTTLIGCIARLHPLKGVDLLASAAALLPAETPAAVFVVGDGEERPLVEEIAATSKVPVRLLGARSDVPALLQAFDILALPSRSEALPLALLEGMAAGCAIVATAVGEMPEILRDGAGVVVPPLDVPKLSEALASLVHDPARREQMGTVARDHVRATFDIEAMVDRYCAVYESTRRG